MPNPTPWTDSLAADDLLIQETLAGSPGAFGVLVQKHQGRAMDIALRMMRNREEAEDVVQQVFLSALVDVVGVRRKIDLGLLQDDKPAPGDWVLIHVGFAMSKISEQDALDQMKTLRVLGEIEGAMQEVQGYGLEEPNDAEVH